MRTRASSSRDTRWCADSSISEKNEVLFEALAALAGQSGNLTFRGIEHIQDTALAQDRSISIGGSADHALLTNKQTADRQNWRGRGD
jgi:hypothetical protein